MANNYNNPDGYYEATLNICIIFFATGLGFIIISSLATFLLLIFSRAQGELWRNLYFKTLLQKNPEFYDLNPEAISGTSIDIECRYIEEALGDDLMLLITGLTLLIGFWVLAMIHSIELTLICLIIYPSQYLGVIISNVKSPEALKNAMSMYSRAGLKSEETLENIKTVASLNCQQSKVQEYSDSVRPLKDSYIKDGVKNGIGWGLNYAVAFAVSGVMFYVATIYTTEDRTTLTGGKINIADMYIVFYSYFMGAMIIGIITTSHKKILRGIASARKILSLGNNIEISTNKKYTLPAGQIGIKFHNVSFSYPSKPTVGILKDLSFHLSPGKKIGFVGTTGCGKSTIAQLVLGFYSPTSGSIHINGISMSELDLKSFRDRVSYVNQEPLLYSETIRENIMLGKQDCNDSDILEALGHAEGLDILEISSEGLNTYVGNKGSLLSGGQKQRIALARAFIRKPKLLILDEATSALDGLTETSILQTVTSVYQDVSLIVIAQRLKTVRNLDCIYFLQEGNIVEKGSFDELMEQKTEFYKLVVAHQPTNAVEESEAIPSVKTMFFSDDLIPDKLGEEKDKLYVKVPLITTQYLCLLAMIVISSMVSGIAFPLFGYFFAHIMVNIFSMDGNGAQKNLDLMAYIIADAVALFISLIVLNYSLAKMFASYTEKIRNDSFSSIVNYDSVFFDNKINSPQRLSSILTG